MKKLVILSILFLIIPFLSAVDIDMKDSFAQRETLLASFSGNFQEILTKDNIFFYRNHVKIPFNFEFMKADNKYYVYALLQDKSPGNYSIEIDNVEYYNQGEIIDDAISENFSISNTLADFSINPGFIYTKEDFEIELQNFQDNEITIEINQEFVEQNESVEGGFLDFLTGNVVMNIEEPNSVTLEPNEIKTIEFNLGDIPEPTLKTITFSSPNTIYEFPLYIPSPVEQERDYAPSLNFEPASLKVSLEPGLTKEESIILENVGGNVLTNISLKLSNDLENYINLSKSNIKSLGLNDSVEILLLFSLGNLSESVEGELTASITNETEDLVIIFEVLVEEGEEDESIMNDEDTSEEIPSVSKNCENINGTLFEEPNECVGEVRFTNDGNCCLGEVKEPEESNTAFIIGWAIIMAILIALVWFFKFKYKMGKEEVDLFKIAKGKK